MSGWRGHPKGYQFKKPTQTLLFLFLWAIAGACVILPQAGDGNLERNHLLFLTLACGCRRPLPQAGAADPTGKRGKGSPGKARLVDFVPLFLFPFALISLTFHFIELKQKEQEQSVHFIFYTTLLCSSLLFCSQVNEKKARNKRAKITKGPFCCFLCC